MTYYEIGLKQSSLLIPPFDDVGICHFIGQLKNWMHRCFFCLFIEANQKYVYFLECSGLIYFVSKARNNDEKLAKQIDFKEDAKNL